MPEGIPIKQAMELYPEVKEMVGKLERGEISMCACMGPMYGEPHCYCTMKRLDLPLNEVEREKERIRFEAQMEALFGPGGIYHEPPSKSTD